MGIKLKLPGKVNKNLANFGRSIDLTNKKSNIRKVSKNVALAPAAPFYAVGAGVNQLSGGKTTTYNVWKAASGKAPAPTYSKLTQAASGYQGAAPGAGVWRAPVLNRSTPVFVGQAAATIIKDVAAPVANAASEGLFGVSLRTLAWGAAVVGTGVLVGPTVVKRLA